ncbi:MAG: ACP S-malonyltransferase [Candidatus Omnitrophica bacterium]|nr:ACP S-malonyltransferase [Candidatus Omnitrophota bacterium]
MVGFLFAGQGSQYVGMGKDLYESFPEARKVFDRAEELLGFELKKRCFEGPEEILKLTNVSQPAIVTASIAAFEVFKTKSNLAPSFAAGLSLGEYSALIAAGSLTFDHGIRLIQKRGQLMEEASRKHPGKMAAVLELPAEKIKDICLKTGAQIANLNCPGQIVITGKVQAVDQAMELCVQEGAKRVVPLEVSGGFHSSLMFEASVGLKLALDNISISEPKIPVVSNYTAKPQYKVDQIIENLVNQIKGSVRWEESMRFILSEGITDFYEFGPGRVLQGLMRRIDSNAEVVNIDKAADMEQLANTRP